MMRNLLTQSKTSKKLRNMNMSKTDRELSSFHNDGVKSFNVLLPEMMSNLLHNLPGIAYRCKNDSKWTMIFLSEACFTLTGYQPEELLYNSLRSFEDIIYEEDRSLVRSAVNQGVSQKTQFQIMYRIITKEGSHKWVWEQGNAVYDQHHNPQYLDGYIVNINEWKQSELENENKNKQLSELNATKDKFFSLIAHDLQNPVYAIITLSTYARENFAQFSVDEILDVIKQIDDSAKNLRSLLENLLHWSRSQTGRLKIQNERIAVASLFQICTSHLESQASLKNIQVECHSADQLYIYSDYHMLCTIMRNLVSNAIKFSHPDSKIKLTARAIESQVEICVEDQGIGMSRQQAAKVFNTDREFKSLGTSKEIGSGLGLILVKDFISRLGGDIKVESKINKGSKFIFRV